MRRTRPVGGIVTIVAAVIAAGAIASVAVSTAISHRARSATPSGRQVALFLGGLGLEPEALAVAEVTDNQLSGIFAEAAEHLTTHGASYESARIELSAANANLAKLEDGIRAGRTSPEALAGLAAMRARAASAATASTTMQGEAIAAVLAELSNEQRMTLQAIRRNRIHGLPTEYLVVDREPQQWLALREAIDNQRITSQRDRPLGSVDEQTLDAANSSSTLVARANLNARLATLSALWTSYSIQ